MNSYTFKLMLFGLALLGLGMMSTHRQEPQAPPEVTNKTTAVQVVSLTPTEHGYELRLRNVSSKNINGYSVAYENGAIHTADLTAGDHVIAPGAEFRLRLNQKQCIIRDVNFDDDSSDGDADAAAELLDRRAGMREQLERIATLLNAATASADVQQLEPQLRVLPEEMAATDRSFYVALGRQNAKEDALLALKRLNKNDMRAGLAKLAELNSKRMMRLTKRVNP